MRTSVLLLCGLLIGGGATVFGLWLGSGEPAATITGAPEVTTTVAAVEEPIWEEAGETRIDSTLIIPGDLTVSAAGEARLMYELRSIAQQYPATYGPYPAALPAKWLLTTTSGATIDGETLPPNRPQSLESGPPPLRDSVVFTLSEGVTAADIASIAVVEWRLAAPIEVVVTLPSTSGGSITLIDGSVATLASVLEQSNGTVFDFDLERQADPWRTQQRQPFFVADETFIPIGDGWSSSSLSLGGGFQITWEGATAPPEIRLLVSTTEWLPVTGNRIVQPVVTDG